MKSTLLVPVFTCFLLFLTTLTYGQASAPASFIVGGEVRTSLRLTKEDLAAMPQHEVKVQDREGKDQIYQGVALWAILDSAGVTLGDELRGENLVKYVLVEALDGYQVIFSLPEIDPAFTDHTILLAYLVDGKVLTAETGPFRMVVPHEKKHARWIREISSIKVMYIKE